jgi:hypothetical protein
MVKEPKDSYKSRLFSFLRAFIDKGSFLAKRQKFYLNKSLYKNKLV